MHLSSEYDNDLRVSSSLSWENLFTQSLCSKNQLGEYCLEFYSGFNSRINFSVGHVYVSHK